VSRLKFGICASGKLDKFGAILASFASLASFANLASLASFARVGYIIV
jgi:hypothetical protein